MSFTPKDWKDSPDASTPLSAAALEDMESRLSAYTLSVESSVALSAATFSGVDRSGVADSAASLATAFTAAAGRELYFPFGTYRLLASGLTVPAAGLTLILDDAVLDMSDLAVDAVGITAPGSLAADVAVNAVAAGATSITGSAGIETGISAGDVLKLKSADVLDPGRTSSTHGELVVVLSTASGTINLRSPVMGAYSTTVKIAKVTAGKLRIKGSGQITGGGSGSQHIGVQARQTRGLRIDGLWTRDVENVAIQAYDCLDFELSNLDIDGSTTPQGYGVSVVNASQYGRVHHSHFRNCRHATSVNNANSTDGGGIPRHITFEANEVRDTTSGGDAMDAHAGSEYINWLDNDIYDAGNVGINAETNKATLKRNRIFRPTDNGIYLLPCAASAPEYVVTGNEVYDGAQYGLRFAGLEGAGASSPLILDVSDNQFVRCAQAAAYLDPSAQTTSPFRLDGARMSRNRAYSCGASGTVATFYMAKADGSEQQDNIVREQPNGLVGCRIHDFTKGKFNGNIVKFTSGGTVAAFRGTSVVGTEIAHNIARTATGAGGNGLRLDGATSTDCRIHDNEMTDTTTPYNTVTGGTGHLIFNNKPGVPLAAIASAAALTLTGSENDVYSITGTTNITSITASWAGRVIKLIFTGILTVTDGSNLKLNGNLVTAAQTTLSLVCDGTNWQELGRSVN